MARPDIHVVPKELSGNIVNANVTPTQISAMDNTQTGLLLTRKE